MNNRQEAVRFAIVAHRGQMRNDGQTPYVTHPTRVMQKLQEYGIVDDAVLAAAVLHDVLEDTPTEELTLQARFGQRITSIVKELTKDKNKPQHEVYIASFTSASPEACLIKLVDREDNLSDWEGMNPKYKAAYAEAGQRILTNIEINAAVKHLLVTAKIYSAAYGQAVQSLKKAIDLSKPQQETTQ